MMELEDAPPNVVYQHHVQSIYQKNLNNLVRVAATAPKQNEKFNELYKEQQEVRALKIDDKDVETLERYEKLLYEQNQRALMKIRLGGSTMLRGKERDELNELVAIREKKKDLIEKLGKAKEENKYKELEERVSMEVLRGIRRSKI